jgi:hypothetical protein
MIKVYTTIFIGKYVRYFIIFLLFGWFFSSCEIQNDNEPADERDNITGTWKCQEVDQSNKTINFEAVISKHATDTAKIWVDNFSALGSGIKVSVGMGGHLLTIPQQTVDGNTISGTGSISSTYNQITWTYSLDDGGGKENYTAKFTR